ncbi:MAG: FGGY family carbohydrate kinase, partial [Atribacterota bacterium]
MRNISKSFPGVRALKKVSLFVKRGEVHGLVGENGAGKSTLMNILGGVLQPDEGDIFINGQKVTIFNPHEAQNLGIAFIHQEPTLFNFLNIARNIFIANLPKKNGQIDFALLYEKSQELLRRVGLKEDPKMLVKDLPLAEKQMVEIAKALSFESKIFVLDEPTSPLTDKEVQNLFRIIRDLKAQGEAVIFLDERGSVLRPAILGMDMRAREESEMLKAHFGEEWLLRTSGVPVHPLTSAAKIFWVRRHEPEIFDKSWKILCYEDFLFFKLGGVPVIDYSMACKTMLFDRLTKKWSSEILEYLGLQEGKLASPVPSGTVIGELREEYIHVFRFSRQLKLVTGGHDQCCAALGAGSTHERIAFDNAGTAEVLGIPVEDGDVVLRIRPLSFSCYGHVLPEKFLLATLNQTAGLFLRWYRDTFKDGAVSYPELLQKVAPEPSPILALPHLVGSGTPWIDASSKAAFVGMTLATRESDILRAILESVVFEQKLNVDLFLE